MTSVPLGRGVEQVKRGLTGGWRRHKKGKRVGGKGVQRGRVGGAEGVCEWVPDTGAGAGATYMSPEQ